MAAWGVIRNVTDQDYEKLEKSARRFADRHEIKYDLKDSIYLQVCDYVNMNLYSHSNPNDFEYSETKKLDLLWKRCQRRALGEPNADGIGYGVIGYEVD